MPSQKQAAGTKMTCEELMNRQMESGVYSREAWTDLAMHLETRLRSLEGRNEELGKALRSARAVIWQAKRIEAYRHTDNHEAIDRFANTHPDIKAIDALLAPAPTKESP